MALFPGTRLGRYEVVAPLGSGGMGDVYQAWDAHLGRMVALKVLHDDVACDPQRLRRLEQEAHALSRLNHPNIVVVYELGEEAGDGFPHPIRYLSMEFLEGESLERLLRGRKLSLERCLDLAVPLADALTRAHESGIVHRDLKPSNIFVTAAGPKVLDFGLAKVESIGTGGPELETLTRPGVVMGTLGYMSPEQALGEAVAAASDQFSFGCILYEMLTGRRAFAAPSGVEAQAAIIRDEPTPVREANPLVPDPLCWIVERCLAKSPEGRYAATRDLVRDLELARKRGRDLAPTSGAHQSGVPRGPRAPAVLAGASVLVTGSLLVGAFLAWQRSAPAVRFRPLTFRNGVVFRALFSPGSAAVLYTAAWDGERARTYQTIPESAGIDRSLDADEHLPLSYSIDGANVLVLLGVPRTSTIMRGTLAWWPALGGRAREILADAGWADWASRSRQLAVVKDTGTERILEIRDHDARVLRTVFRTHGAVSHVRFSPDERQVAFILHPTPVEDGGEVWRAAVDGSGAQALTARFQACYGLDWNRATGEVWFTGARDSAWATGVWAVTTRGRLRLVQATPSYHVLQNISPDGGRCLLLRADSVAEMFVRRKGFPPENRSWFGWSIVTDLSRDGRQLLFYEGGAAPGTFGTWIRPLEGGDAVRLTEGVPSRLSPDARLVATVFEPAGQPPQIGLIPVGAGERRTLTAPPASHASPSFASNASLLFVRTEGGASEVWRMGTDGAGGGSLGASSCELPEADPAGASFLCLTDQGRTLQVFPMTKGPGRAVHTVEKTRFKFARWDVRGDRIFAFTSDRRLLTLDARRGERLEEETLPYPGGGEYDRLVGAALNADASLQVYSIIRSSASLHEMSGMR